MNGRLTGILILAVVGTLQFLVLPIFVNMALGGKVAAFSLFVLGLAGYMLRKKRRWFLPAALLPLTGLVLAYGVSALGATVPILGVEELWTLAMGVLFCLLVANCARGSDYLERKAFDWLALVGVVVAVLCLYQYVHWLSGGELNKMLIPYILPPPLRNRVTGIYGQPNIMALLLLLSMVSWGYRYFSEKRGRYALVDAGNDLGFFLVALAFFLTGSRAGLVALACVAGTGAVFSSRRMLTFSPGAIARMSVLLIAGFLISKISLQSAASVVEPVMRTSLGIDGRFVFQTASVLMFLDSPFLGVGPDHFRVLLPEYAMAAHGLLGFVLYEAMGYTNWSHNEYLQILAESGLIGFSLLTIFLFCIFRSLHSRIAVEGSQRHIFYLLFLLAFLLQALFSWQMRHPGLFPIFMLLIGIIVSRDKGISIEVGPWVKHLVTPIIFLLAFGVFYLSFKEYNFNQIKKSISVDGCRQDNVFAALDDPYLRFTALRNLLPMCIEDEKSIPEPEMLRRLEPHFLDIAQLQGTHEQWYNLGVVYRQLHKYEEAKKALQKSVERQPVFEEGWAALHMLHVEEAVRKTGRPIEDFLPPDDINSTDRYDSLFKGR